MSAGGAALETLKTSGSCGPRLLRDAQASGWRCDTFTGHKACGVRLRARSATFQLSWREVAHGGLLTWRAAGMQPPHVWRSSTLNAHIAQLICVFRSRVRPPNWGSVISCHESAGEQQGGLPSRCGVALILSMVPLCCCVVIPGADIWNHKCLQCEYPQLWAKGNQPKYGV